MYDIPWWWLFRYSKEQLMAYDEAVFNREYMWWCKWLLDNAVVVSDEDIEDMGEEEDE